ncbi:type III-B CRISPR module RAMP protein Cmr6 [Hahella sp. CCB-MM4]|uniref:type III-B CRISPR module RAMP protein Cmr6 n=1 Tax=Hahella sp. (strain CCB-MM4) TaxID=1926491 RepID=UPI000B9AF711|nr:type III-B CRISPR module RAMP protein Cmr6 [Hahella sp. CCB-MM4]OZG70351.1 type III-B CRISPR module RAMP protein Cmr6 [Hahella sp. CCB-MM4]
MTLLIRQTLRQCFGQAAEAHPGLLLQKGLPEIEENGNGQPQENESGEASPKTAHIKRMCNILAPDRYMRAFDRWNDLTADSTRFERCVMKLENRMLIGLSGTGALETGCTLSHCHGMPYIPGSSIKGVVRAWAEKQLPGKQKIIQQLLGTPQNELLPNLAGVVNFHDAWWIPNNQKPFVQEIVTSHHKDYYADGGATPASDLDSPVPNALIGVRGSFLFVLEGRTEYTGPAMKMLKRALQENGIGAKTASGYGYMRPDQKQENRLQGETRQRMEEREDARLTDTHRIIKNLTQMLEKKESSHASGHLRQALKQAIGGATGWPHSDLLALQQVTIDCVRYWDPRKKNRKLKELKKEVEDLLNGN